MIATPRCYFEDLWEGSADPWDHAGRWYETRKYDLTVASLPSPVYSHAVEPACGVGLLTTRLAARAQRVTASDRYPRAVQEAGVRCRDLHQVTVSERDILDGPPPDPFDLAVLSEVLYYFDAGTVAVVVDDWYRACDSAGHLVLAHYRPHVDEHVLTGDDVHEIAADVCGAPLTSIVDTQFRIAVFATDAAPRDRTAPAPHG